MQIPYATSTPNANDANTAEIKTIEFTATPFEVRPTPARFYCHIIAANQTILTMPQT